MNQKSIDVQILFGSNLCIYSLYYIMDAYCFIYVYIFLCNWWHKFIVLKTSFKKFSLIHKAHKAVKLLKGKNGHVWLLWDRNIQAGLITRAMMELQQVQNNMNAKSRGLLQIPHSNKPYRLYPCNYGFSPLWNAS